MKIAIDVRSLMEGRHSGVEEYTIRLIEAMVSASGMGREFELFYNSWQPVAVPTFGSATLRGFSYPNKLLNVSQLLFNRPLWSSLVEADVFFVPNPRLLPVALGTPYVVTVHDLSFERFPEFYSWQRRAWHKLVRARFLVSNADHVIAVSQATADDVMELYGVPERRVSVIHSGISSSTESVRGTWLDDLPERFVLFLGTLEPRKNVVSIVEAFSVIAEKVSHDLVIAGEQGWLMRDVQRAIEQSPVSGRIHQIGFVDEKDKQALYVAADLFVYPSFYEGFGFPPLEALLAGTPVITSFNSALPEIVGEWATLINPYDVGELALVMEELLVHPVVVPANVGDQIRQRYSWERAAQETLTVLEEVA